MTTEPVYTHEQRNAVIAALLEHLDVAYPGMHIRGSTPDWYVAAAAVSCDIKPQGHQTTDIMVGYVKYDSLGNTPRQTAELDSVYRQYNVYEDFIVTLGDTEVNENDI